MQFLIKKTYVHTEVSLSESTVKDDADLAYVISKKLQHHFHNVIADDIIESVKVYIKYESDTDWQLAYSREGAIKEDD